MTPIAEHPALRYRGDGRWELTEDLVYFHDRYGPIEVPEGFVSDLDSVPRLPLAYLLTKNASVTGAVIHDYLYQSAMIGTKQITRADADRIFLDVMYDEDVPWWQRRMVWLGVRLGGRIPWNKHRDADPTFI